MHPGDLEELKELRETTETCWRLMDLARLRRGSPEECAALAEAYRAAEARYRARRHEHLRLLRPDPGDPWGL